ncbi:MAG: hypothetical protein CTY31_04240 [Hyphomicrobium sp.]|nr:MAG: hypothetical protein CTY39_03570 [Hyphomicrobium sp.]PPD00365.1 MAG: hypothetical protein CTY31_04240 [Hyphomicrobium sp.]
MNAELGAQFSCDVIDRRAHYVAGVSASRTIDSALIGGLFPYKDKGQGYVLGVHVVREPQAQTD